MAVVRRRSIFAALLAALVAAPLTGAGLQPTTAAPAGPTDLDWLMERVLARRDENWKKMRQYVLDERVRLTVTGPDRARLFGFVREYTWFIRQGFFIRSPLTVDGVTVGDADRVRYETRWLARERSREKRRLAREKGAAVDRVEDPATTPSAEGTNVEDVIQSSLEPRFVSAAYFLEFKFDPGHYALAGRESRDGRQVLRIEYYPSRLFTEGRTRPNRRVREKDEDVEQKMNKVSLVTLWIDPAEHQILEYTFDNIDMDFLPARSLVRVDELKASMRMTEPFPDVWLPSSIEMQFGMTLAIGTVDARYDIGYHDYRLADVTTRIRP